MAIAAPTDKRFRRAHVSPARRRGLFHLSTRHLAIVGLLTGVALYAGYWVAALILSSDVLTVTRITVSGNARLSRGEVLSLLDGIEGRNMLLIDLDEWRQKMLASPWVADAAIRRELPGTLDVLISERHPLGIGRMGDALYLLDERGKIIDEFGPGHADVDLPLIDGLVHRADPHAAPSVDESRAALAVRLLVSLQEHRDLARRVSQIDVTDVRDAAVILKGDTALIRVGEEEFSERLRSYLDLAPALHERVPEIDYVDLRFGERIYVRPHPSTSARGALSGVEGQVPGLRARKTGGG